MKNYTTHIEYSMEKEYKRKLNDIKQFYKNEMRDLLRQFNKGRSEAVSIGFHKFWVSFTGFYDLIF